ncbi:MAG TPA: S1C family serine protease [Bacteroidia bacterium]|nr:S1C family serine protease [Bacteroidia bacterium]
MNKAKAAIFIFIDFFSFLCITAQDKFYEENFSQNILNWETGKTDNSESFFQKNAYIIKSESATGTTRLIRSPYGTDVCNISCEIDNTSNFSENKVGIIFGFESWRDYSYFVFDKKYVHIGNVSNNVPQKQVDGVYLDKIINGKNSLQVIYEDTKVHFYLNGVLIYESKILRNKGNKLGFVVAKNGVMKVTYFKVSQTSEKTKQNEISEENKTVKNFGCGLLFPKEGYVITCNTNLDLGNQILVDINNKTYAASKIFVNDILDLALIKLEGFEAHNSTNPVLTLRPLKSADSLRICSFKSALGDKEIRIDSIIATQFNHSIPSENSLFRYQDANATKIAGALLVNNKKQIVGMTMRKKDRSTALYKNSDLLAFIDASNIDLNMSNYASTHSDAADPAIEDFLVFIRTK